MLADRGYDISRDRWILEENDLLTIENFYKIYDDVSKLSGIYNSTDSGIYVNYVRSNKPIGVDLITEYVIQIKLLKIDGMLITNQEFTNNAKKLIQSVNFQTIQIFMEEELMFNVIKHSFVPKHELLTDAEVKELTKTIRLKQLSEIYITDPVVRYYNWPMYSVVRVYEEDQNGLISSVTINYRLITPSSLITSSSL